MENYYVAPSYQKLERVGEPYEVNGKMYQTIRMKNGKEKTVRAYNQKDYNKYYPKVEIIQPAKSRRDVLGFGEAGYIWIFKGNTPNATYENLDWFRLSPCRYTRLWGWYLSSSEELPDPLPVGIEPVKLSWDEVSFDGDLLEDKDIVKVVDSKLYDAGVSKWVGKIGERLTLTLKCVRMVETQNAYGFGTFFVFEDEEQNIFTWSTQVNTGIEENKWYQIVGTVVEHNLYRNSHQTKINRCKVIKNLDDID